MPLSSLDFDESLDHLIAEWRHKPAGNEIWIDLDFLQDPEPQRSPWYGQRGQNETDADWVRRLRRMKLWYLMVAPEPDRRGFFRACRCARRNGASATLDKWLEEGGPLAEILFPSGHGHQWPWFEAHLLCARKAVEPAFWPEDGSVAKSVLEEIRERTQPSSGLPPGPGGDGEAIRPSTGFLLDLARELLDRQLQPAKRSASLAVVLLDPEKERARTLNLVLDVVSVDGAVSNGQDEFYPAPEMALIDRDSQYHWAESNACRFVRQRFGSGEGHAFRWRLAKRDREPLPTAIKGPSTSAAVGLLQAHLTAAMHVSRAHGDQPPELSLLEPAQADLWSAVEELSRLNLSGVAVSAEVDANGDLKAIGGAYKKTIDPKYDDRALPRIHTILFAKEQLKDVEKTPVDTKTEPHDRFQPHFVGSLEESAYRLALNTRSRWPRIVDQASDLNRFRSPVGLDHEKKEVTAFLGAESGGYQLIRGRQFVGKSTFASHLIKECPWPVAYHFIRSDRDNWDDPEIVLSSLTDQLRLLFALPGREDGQGKTAVEKFRAVLHMAGNLLEDDPTRHDQRAVVILDGLDHAFGLEKRCQAQLLKDLLPRQLPARVKVILTSRPGGHLHHERCPSYDPIEFEPWRTRVASPGTDGETERNAETLTMISNDKTLSEALWALSVFTEPVPLAALRFVRPDITSKTWKNEIIPYFTRIRIVDSFDFGELGALEDHYVVGPYFREPAYRLVPDEGVAHTRKTLHRRAASYYRKVAEGLARGRDLAKAPEWDADGRWMHSVDQLFDHLWRAEAWEDLLDVEHHPMIHNAGVVKYIWGYYKQCEDVVDRMLDAAARLDREEIQAEWRHAQAVLYHTQGKLAEAEEACEAGRKLIAQSRRPFERNDPRLLKAHLLCRRGMVLRDQGRYRAAMDQFRKSAELKRAADADPDDVLYNMSLYAETLAELGGFDEAEKILEPALESVQKNALQKKGVVHRVCSFTPLFARVLRKQGQYTKGELLTANARALARDLPHWLHLVQNLREAALLAMATPSLDCDWGSAERSFQEIEQSSRFAKSVEYLPASETTRTQLTRGYFHHMRHNLSEARRCYKDAVAPDLIPSNYQGEILLGALGLQESLKLTVKSPDEPRDHLERGIKRCESLLAKSPEAFEAAYYLARAHLVTGRLREVNGHADAAEACYRSARLHREAAWRLCSASGVCDEELQFLELIGCTLAPTAQFSAALECARDLFG